MHHRNWKALLTIVICSMIGTLLAGITSGILNFGGTWLPGVGAGLGTMGGIALAQKRFNSGSS